MSTQPQHKKSLHWLTSGKNYRHEYRAGLLRESHFDVLFSTSLAQTLQSFVQRKAGIILISDFGTEEEVKKAISTLSHYPETQGVKFVYTYSEFNQSLSDAAAIHAFRDLIPDDLDDKSWLDRMLYAVGETFSISDSRPFTLSVLERASINIPARVVSVNQTSIRIESRLSATPGDQIGISGELAKAFGQRRIGVTIDSVDKRDLNFRFSDSISGTWQVPPESSTRSAQLIDRLIQHHSSRRMKIFIATKDVGIRSQLVGQLDSLRFDINVALQVNSLVHEPAFISPHVVFLDEPLIRAIKPNILSKMLQSLPTHCTLIILGSSLAILGKVQELSGQLRAQLYSGAVSQDFSRLLLNDYLLPQTRQHLNSAERNAYIPFDHPFSVAEITVPSRITSIHPQFITLASTTRIQKFGLVKVESPFIQKMLGNEPYVKIVDIRPSQPDSDERFPFTQIGRISELDTSRSKRYRDSILQLLADGLRVKPVKDSEAPPLLNQTSTPVPLVAGVQAASLTRSPGIQELEIKAYPTNEVESKPQPPKASLREEKTQSRMDVRAAQERILKRSKGSNGLDKKIIDAIASRPFRSLATFLIVSFIFFACVAIFTEYIQPEWTQSRSEFDDKFMKLDPDKFGLPEATVEPK